MLWGSNMYVTIKETFIAFKKVFLRIAQGVVDVNVGLVDTTLHAGSAAIGGAQKAKSWARHQIEGDVDVDDVASAKLVAGRAADKIESQRGVGADTPREGKKGKPHTRLRAKPANVQHNDY